MKKDKKIWKVLGRLVICLLLLPLNIITAYAVNTTEDMAQYPNVTLSPDGSNQAWTTDMGDKTNERLPLGYTIDMNVESSLGVLQAGEHYYSKKAEGGVRIGKWVVRQSPSQCIHDTPMKENFGGFNFNEQRCHKYYNSGWFMYCADCGDEVHSVFIYAREETVKRITAVPAASTYVYLCPHCSHLEQGVEYQHICKGISSNRYSVLYKGNAPSDSVVTGFVAQTQHLYNNSSTYNGVAAADIGYADKALRKNSFSCIGYIFTGWNTEPDGSGRAFGDAQEIMNLTAEENGIVILYAQWQKAESSLIIDAAGGTYNGAAVFEQKQNYGTNYLVKSSLLRMPIGYTVSFVTNGGDVVSSITTTKRFSHWEIQSGFSGKFKDNIYTFPAENGHRDTIKAIYLNNSFVLPDCKASNSSLVGWYDNPSLDETGFIGRPGEEITVDRDTVLYAKWADLILWADDDYESYGGSGAVDLRWEQKDGKSKYYRLYQSKDKESWTGIFAVNDLQESIKVTESFGIAQQGTAYEIPYTGNYTISASGGKGADYSTQLIGGKGGRVTATYWLTEGDVLTVYSGTSGNGTDGGTNGNGADGGNASNSQGRGGGAATQVYLSRNGNKTLLLTAGGGGGANAYYMGGDGGTGGGNGTLTEGAGGIGAGGGGYVGGLTGTYEIHNHSGSSSMANGCYTAELYCGGNISTYEEEEIIGGYYAGCCGEGTTAQNGVCVQCSHDHSNGTHCVHAWYEGGDTEHRCDKCNLIYEENIGTCIKITGYGLACGMIQGQIISVSPSNGGTNYIAEIYGCKNQKSEIGIHNGNGTVSVSSQNIGYLEEIRLDNVPAKDLAAPNIISKYSVSKISEITYRISLTTPEDNGTVYYHRAESYQEGTIVKLADSNMTENVLMSGIAGYRYYVDEKATGTIKNIHSFTENSYLDVKIPAAPQYLHIAAEDVAGNIGLTIHIPLFDLEKEEGGTDIPDTSGGKEEMPTPKTELMELAASENRYAAGGNRYYVKADGTAEHTLTIRGYLEETVAEQYQIDCLQMVSEAADLQEWYRATLPKTGVNNGHASFANEELVTNASVGELQLLTPSWATAVRTGPRKAVKLEQRFRVSAANDGKQITVYPRAVVKYNDEELFSDLSEDKANGLLLIADGSAPVIMGIEALERAGNIDMTQEEIDYVISAYDEGSGVRSLKVIVDNQDNGMSRTYTADVGSLIITMRKDDYLFLGDFVVAAEAVDNVGNHNSVGSDKLAFSLEADLKRSREPYDSDFKAGDGAVLTITTGGYADKVIIRFPEILLQLNPDLNREYIYEYPEAIRTEIYEFNIPLTTVKGNYLIEVEAWKEGRKLTEELELPVNIIGSVLDELRTRIRDNG